MRGGKREGAGRPKGSPNKVTAAQTAAVEASGLTPLQYMLQVLRDDDVPLLTRLDAANKAAPYVHPKRAPVDGDGQTQPGAVVYIETGRTVPRA